MYKFYIDFNYIWFFLCVFHSETKHETLSWVLSNIHLWFLILWDGWKIPTLINSLLFHKPKKFEGHKRKQNHLLLTLSIQHNNQSWRYARILFGFFKIMWMRCHKKICEKLVCNWDIYRGFFYLQVSNEEKYYKRK